MALLDVSVVSADQEIWSGQAKQITAKTSEGEIGILPDHEPILALLANGQVRVTTAEGQRVTVNAEEGFFSVDRNQVQVVASRANLAS